MIEWRLVSFHSGRWVYTSGEYCPILFLNLYTFYSIYFFSPLFSRHRLSFFLPHTFFLFLIVKIWTISLALFSRVNNTADRCCDSRCTVDQFSARITTHQSIYLSISEPNISQLLPTTLSIPFPMPCRPCLLAILLHIDPNLPAVAMSYGSRISTISIMIISTSTDSQIMERCAPYRASAMLGYS